MPLLRFGSSRMRKIQMCIGLITEHTRAVVLFVTESYLNVGASSEGLRA